MFIKKRMIIKDGKYYCKQHYNGLKRIPGFQMKTLEKLGIKINDEGVTIKPKDLNTLIL